MSPEWRNSFEQFVRDMGERPDGLTLDRINVDGNYEAGNCRWASTALQMTNRRTSVMWRGEQLTVKALAERIGVPRTSLNKLLRKGLLPEIAVEHALKVRKGH